MTGRIRTCGGTCTRPKSTSRKYTCIFTRREGRSRICGSQFFSVDTAKSLVKMNEYYPDLMDRIVRREPNAYLAALYWDSEMFRRSTRKRAEAEERKDWKAEVFSLLKEPARNFPTKGGMENAKTIVQFLVKYGFLIENRVYRTIYDSLVGGDPKRRTLRAIITQVNCDYANANRKDKKIGK